ncbi:MAG: hypothetical protein ABGY96_20185 [bacterium]|nr:hypothetical protein [Gammaproteobacteria bacterium]
MIVIMNRQMSAIFLFCQHLYREAERPVDYPFVLFYGCVECGLSHDINPYGGIDCVMIMRYCLQDINTRLSIGTAKFDIV